MKCNTISPGIKDSDFDELVNLNDHELSDKISDIKLLSTLCKKLKHKQKYQKGWPSVSTITQRKGGQ